MTGLLWRKGKFERSVSPLGHLFRTDLDRRAEWQRQGQGVAVKATSRRECRNGLGWRDGQSLNLRRITDPCGGRSIVTKEEQGGRHHRIEVRISRLGGHLKASRSVQEEASALIPRCDSDGHVQDHTPARPLRLGRPHQNAQSQNRCHQRTSHGAPLPHRSTTVAAS